MTFDNIGNWPWRIELFLGKELFFKSIGSNERFKNEIEDNKLMQWIQRFPTKLILWPMVFKETTRQCWSILVGKTGQIPVMG